MTNANAPLKPRRPIKETARLGRAIYKETILPLVEADHFGEYVAVDVETGDWTIADSAMAASKALRAQRPDAVDILCERVGYKALRSFGGAALGRPD